MVGTGRINTITHKLKMCIELKTSETVNWYETKTLDSIKLFNIKLIMWQPLSRHYVLRKLWSVLKSHIYYKIWISKEKTGVEITMCIHILLNNCKH